MAISSKHAHLILLSIIKVSMMSKFDMTDLGLPKIFFIKKYSLEIRRGFSSPRTNSGENFFFKIVKLKKKNIFRHFILRSIRICGAGEGTFKSLLGDFSTRKKRFFSNHSQPYQRFPDLLSSRRRPKWRDSNRYIRSDEQKH